MIFIRLVSEKLLCPIGWWVLYRIRVTTKQIASGMVALALIAEVLQSGSVWRRKPAMFGMGRVESRQLHCSARQLHLTYNWEFGLGNGM